MNDLRIKELIEGLRRCAEIERCFDCPFIRVTDCATELMKAAADKLEHLLGEKKWIERKLALPTDPDEYLVMVAGAKKPTVLWYDPEEEMFYEEGTDFEPIYYSVTHWAELPCAPEKTPSADTGRPIKANEVVFSDREGREAVCSRKQENADLLAPPARRRCATCAYEVRMAEEERCRKCEKHSLWEEK